MSYRRQPDKGVAGKGLALQHRKPVWSIILLLCVGMLNGCGAPPTSTTALRQQPPSTEVSHPFHGRVKTLGGAFTVTLDITPNRSGPNVFVVRVMDNRTGKSAPRLDITLYTTMQDMAMGTDSIMLRGDRQGQFSATSANLSMDGHWAIGITIQTPDHTIYKAGMSLVTPS